ncbi:MAG: ATP-binding protein [Clostridia bacterium]|nr:ATP-binding protein [Clostridia bacterium]
MFDNIYAREYYLNKIRGFYRDDMIKVITGVRRCGKSSFIKSVANDLEASGVSTENIIYIDLDSKPYLKVTTPDALEKVIDEKVGGNREYKYLLIDEIQNVAGFEPLINAYRNEGNISVFLTGSNSYLLSGELTTKLTGRYIEIEMFPLNFFEYLELKKFFGKSVLDTSEEFNQYIRYGGFPKTVEYDSPEDKELYIKDVIEQIIVKDIRKHKKVRNLSVFDRVMTYMINNYGATVNLTNILNYFRNEEKLNITQETLYGYIKLLENAKILYKCPRFDLKSRKSLKGEQKYYLADPGIYFSNNADARINYGPALENLVFTYLKAKGYSLSIGKIGKLECDFIARKNNDYCYAQVAMTIAERSTEDREYASLEKIKDNYPKYLFTLDPLLQRRNGIIHKNLADFMKNNEDL